MRFGAMFAAAVAAALLASAAQAMQVPSQPLNYTVLRDGAPVGRHVVTFQPTDGGTKVDITTDVAVKIAFITVYRFEHKGSEVWKDARLVALTSKTNDDGTDHQLQVEAKGDGLHVVGDGKATKADPGIVPASLWNPSLVTQNVLLNTLDGQQMRVTVTDKGADTVMVQGKGVPARRYVVDGDLKRELWYDEAGTLVQIRFKAKDDSDILYVLR
jgi:hypothetical protein